MPDNEKAYPLIGQVDTYADPPRASWNHPFDIRESWDILHPATLYSDFGNSHEKNPHMGNNEQGVVGGPVDQKTDGFLEKLRTRMNARRNTVSWNLSESRLG